MRSDIQVDVQWRDAAIFAGQELACIITFRNQPDGDYLDTDPTSCASPRRSSPLHAQALRRPSAGLRTLAASDSPRAKQYEQNTTPRRPHHARKTSVTPVALNTITRPGHTSRSLSVVSIGSGTASRSIPVSPIEAPTSPWRGSGRSGSVQLLDTPRSATHDKSVHGEISQVTNAESTRHDHDTDTMPSISARSSLDLQARGRYSQDTIASELPSTLHNSARSHVSKPKEKTMNDGKTEHIMMAYVQIMGNMIMDPSLVDQTPFEDVKRRGALGEQSDGGVVAINHTQPQLNTLASSTWASVTTGFSAALGIEDNNSIPSIQSTLTSRNVPLLCSAQTLLLVDTKLAPGDNKSYLYTFRVPNGLPPTHRGRACKVQYNARVSMQQTATTTSRKATQRFEFPFRMLSAVDAEGEALGHDLMSPHIMLKDTANTKEISFATATRLTGAVSKKSRDKFDKSELMQYTNWLLDHGTATPRAMSFVSPSQSASAKTTVSRDTSRVGSDEESPDIQSTDPVNAITASPNDHFVVVKGNRHIGLISLLSYTYKLGEPVIGTINFSPLADSHNDHGASEKDSNPSQRTYITNISLETTERIDPSLAQRSIASVQRATRKVHASTTTCALFALQQGFLLELPLTATQSFETTAVSMDWALRVEMVTQASETRDESLNYGRTSDVRSSSEHADSIEDKQDVSQVFDDEMMQTVSTDERERVLVAKEDLDAERFEIRIPLRVHGVCERGLAMPLSGTILHPWPA